MTTAEEARAEAARRRKLQDGWFDAARKRGPVQSTPKKPKTVTPRQYCRLMALAPTWEQACDGSRKPGPFERYATALGLVAGDYVRVDYFDPMNYLRDRYGPQPEAERG